MGSGSGEGRRSTLSSVPRRRAISARLRKAPSGTAKRSSSPSPRVRATVRSVPRRRMPSRTASSRAVKSVKPSAQTPSAPTEQSAIPSARRAAASRQSPSRRICTASQASITMAMSSSFSRMTPEAFSAAARRSPGVVMALCSSSAVDMRRRRKSARRLLSPKRRRPGPTSSRARAMSSSRPPLSGRGSARPPSSTAARLYILVKLSTSPQRLSRGPQTAARRRSARWDCCSGVSSTMPPVCSIRALISSQTRRVFPQPAAPSSSLSISPPPFDAKTS